MTTSKWLLLVMTSFTLLGCGGGEDTQPGAPNLQGSNLYYGSTATFYIGVTTLNDGVNLSVEKCTNLTQTNSTNPAYLAYKCKLSGTGSVNLTATDLNGKVLATQSFTIPAPQVKMVTSLGTVVLELNPNQAPITVDNFLKYVTSGFYNGTLFHRVIPNFVIQAGGYSTGLKAMDPKYPPIALETNNGLSNLEGTLAMARTSDPNSATSQFYVNLVDNKNLDYVSSGDPGYAVFGKIISGIDVVRAIGSSATSTQNEMNDVPNTEISVTSMTRLQ